MVRVSVEVCNGTALFRVKVQAESIRRAEAIVRALNPGGDTRVVFPIEPEGFFVRSPGAKAGLIEVEPPEAAAG